MSVEVLVLIDPAARRELTLTLERPKGGNGGGVLARLVARMMGCCKGGRAAADLGRDLGTLTLHLDFTALSE